jgi:hypothetical protein
MPRDPQLDAHREWLGFVQPEGLVVSPAALVNAQAWLDRNVVDEQARLRALFPQKDDEPAEPIVPDVRTLLREVLGWRAEDLREPPAELAVSLPEYGETLRPTWVVAAPEAATNGAGPWQMLVQELPPRTPLDDAGDPDPRRWQASPQARFERLLRDREVSTGLLANGTHLRLVYAPHGETSGHCTFPVAAMAEVAGRPILAALKLLLSAERLFVLPPAERLPALLAESRKYQNLVSTQLADQVLAALWELLRGFQAADAARDAAILREPLREDPDHIYGGLLAVLMRLVFILYAEDRGLLPRDEVWTRHYSLGGLYERLRADAGRFPDTMDRRYGAWAQLLALFRLLHDGGGHGGLRLPARRGGLFDPDRYPFLEGRPWRSARQRGERVEPPLVSDGVVYRVLDALLVLDGERLSYRALDVEQIGSVYEAIIGFELLEATGPTVAVRSSKGAPVPIDLEALIATAPGGRVAWLREQTDQTIDGKAAAALRDAGAPEEAVAALARRVVKAVTPAIAPPGTLVLRPTEERRRSGSFYTPRSLTEPIVRTTLRPVLAALGERPAPEQILALTVCDPAMGSGAFLVEACRQLGDALVAAWQAHGRPPAIPPDEDEVLHARRLVAQRCLYGVDRNPMAVDLAKLSLWLTTLARDHDFTFLDHALRPGDSLVGLTAQEIVAFDWTPAGRPLPYLRALLEDRLATARALRARITEAGDEAADEPALRLALREADEALDALRLVGDLVVAAFFEGSGDRERLRLRRDIADEYVAHHNTPERFRARVEALRSRRPPVRPFHWEIEFAEVFGRECPGFDAIVGNPPFMGGSKISSVLGPAYRGWLSTIHRASHGNADLVAHFYRRAFGLVREDGTFGLIATNTIAQGDTRATGLAWLCTNGGTIFAARRRLKWPGEAAVVVSVVHVRRGRLDGPYDLDGRAVPMITAYLFHAGGHELDSEKFCGALLVGYAAILKG